MKVIVKPHNIQVISTPVNELEVNVTTVEFEFSEEITEDFVKEAYFTLDDETYKQVIVNNMCEIPSEVLTKVGTIELGVVAYYADPVNDELIRYNPKPGYFTSWEGSLRDAENSEPITPSEMEQFETALNDGLETLDNALDDLQDKVDSGYFDGQDGADGITPTIGDNGNWYLGTTDTGKPSRGEQGVQGPAGQDGKDGKDGTDGRDGTNGTDGADGFSPIANVSKVNTTATITITDKNGTTTTTISDGTNGTNGQDGVGVPSGGTQGQILSKNSATNYDTTWIDAVGSETFLGEVSDYNSSANALDITNLKKGVYHIATSLYGNSVPSTFYVKITLNGVDYANDIGRLTTNPISLIKMAIPDTLAVGSKIYFYTEVLSITSADSKEIGFYEAVYNITDNGLVYDKGKGGKIEKIVTENDSQTIFGKKTFEILPESSVTPTSNNQLVNKQYVDNSIASAITDALGGSY